MFVLSFFEIDPESGERQRNEVLTASQDRRAIGILGAGLGVVVVAHGIARLYQCWRSGVTPQCSVSD